MLLRNAVGRPVSGGDFYDREPEQRRIWSFLDTDNLLLLRVLEGDGYIVRVQQRYLFRSPLLRAFWVRDD